MAVHKRLAPLESLMLWGGLAVATATGLAKGVLDMGLQDYG